MLKLLGSLCFLLAVSSCGPSRISYYDVVAHEPIEKVKMNDGEVIEFSSPGASYVESTREVVGTDNTSHIERKMPVAKISEFYKSSSTGSTVLWTLGIIATVGLIALIYLGAGIAGTTL